MLTKEDNERLTRVGPGTPGGELLRRYWQPVAGLNELSEDNPTHFVRMLGEDLVLFRDKSGRVGLIGDHCAHRGASLLYGRVEERGLSCAYHGWLYDTQGNVLECPAEPEGSLFHLTVKQRAYPVQELFGLYWAYLGPLPAPPIRKLDIMQFPVLHLDIDMVFDANWVQIVENNLDGSHIFILHQDTYVVARDQNGEKRRATSTTRGLIDDLVGLEYEETRHGILRTMTVSDGYVEQDLLVFPNMLRRMNMLSIKVPIDDLRTRKFAVLADLGSSGRSLPSKGPTDQYAAPRSGGKSPEGALYPNASYRQDKVPFQDQIVIETQGQISPRETWRSGTRDNGIALFDEIVLREIAKVEQGLAPLGAVLDPGEIVDTNIEEVFAVGIR